MNPRNSLYGTTTMTPLERATGRFMRAPDHPGGDGGSGGGTAATGTDAGGGTQNQGGNNGGGNSGDSSGTGKTTENNSGQDPALTRFWSEPEPKAEGGDESGGSQKGKESDKGPDAQGSGSEHGKQLVERLNGLKFDDVFTPEVADEIAENNFKGANERFAGLARESIRQSVIMSAQLMQVFGTQVMAKAEALIAEKLGNRDNDATLLEAFPSAADPQARPLIQSVFNQALKHSGGDRTKAKSLTREMLKLIGPKVASDFGFETPPGSREDYLGDGPKALVDELLARG